MKKSIKVASILLALITCCTVFLTSCDGSNRAKQKKYDNAMALIGEGKYEEAYAIFEKLGDYSNAKTELAKFRYIPTKKSYIKTENNHHASKLSTFSTSLSTSPKPLRPNGLPYFIHIFTISLTMFSPFFDSLLGFA